jgi:hypothetical protein
MALNPTVFTEKVVRSFLRYQLTAYHFSDEGLHNQMRRLLSLGDNVHEITTSGASRKKNRGRKSFYYFRQPLPSQR